MKDNKTTVAEIKSRVIKFVRERDWEQFHSPKNLSMSIAIEAAELMEKFQWLTNEESFSLCKDQRQRQEIESEVADIATFILDFCNMGGMDLSSAIEKKLRESGKKYPAKRVKGKAHKYTYYQRTEK